MQYFGVIQTKYEEIFLTSSYLYISKNEEDIKSSKDIEDMIKNHKLRKKNIVGTVFLYNPLVTPLNFDSNKFLLEQDFKSFETLIELKIEHNVTIFKNALKGYGGKLIELKNLFNLNEKNIDASSLLMKFNADLERYSSNLNTEFDRDIMYQNARELIPNGKFVFFAWGDKLRSKEFPFIFDYAKTIYENSVKLGKKVAFVYKKERSIEFSIEQLQFSNPCENLKFKDSIIEAIKSSFANEIVEPKSYI